MKFLSWFNYFRHNNSLFIYQCSKEEYVSVPRGMSVSIIYLINHNDLARTHPQKLRSQNLTSRFFIPITILALLTLLINGITSGPLLFHVSVLFHLD